MTGGRTIPAARRVLPLLLPALLTAAALAQHGGHGTAAAGDADAFARYRPLDVSWLANRRLEDVTGVFPDPIDAARVLVATPEGLLASDDAGATFHPLPAASAGKVGAVTDIAFRPDLPGTFYLATAGRGLWVTEDGGKSFRPLARKADGLAGDHTVRLILWPRDPRLKTLYACHGREARGISVSHDGGESWRIVGGDYHAWNVFPPPHGVYGPRKLVIAAAAARPNVQNVYTCSALSDYWTESVADVVYNDAVSVADDHYVCLATADRGLQRVHHGGMTRVGPPDADRVAAVAATWGVGPEQEAVYAYQPTKLGLLVSTDGMQTWRRLGRGLKVGPFVREGARLAAAANGKRLFAVVNGGLSVGYVHTGTLNIVQTGTRPPVFAYERTAFEQAVSDFQDVLFRFRDYPTAAAGARELLARAAAVDETYRGGDVTLTARVIARRTSARAVLADLSDFYGDGNTPMHDDGAHGDGEADDGVYGARFRLDPRRLKNPRTRKPVKPGANAVAIRAVGEDGTTAGAVAVLGIFDRPDSLVYWHRDENVPFEVIDGNATVVRGAPDEECFSSYDCLKIRTPAAAWAARLGRPWQARNVAGYHAMSFWVRSGAPPRQELFVQVQDAPEYDYETVTPPIPVVGEGLVDGGRIDETYRIVVIPMERLLKGTEGFRPERMGRVTFAGKGPQPATYWIDRIVFHVDADSVAEERKLADLPYGQRRRLP